MSGGVTASRVVQDSVVYTALLDASRGRVEDAIKTGNPSAIEAAAAAYYELREDVERIEQADARRVAR